MGHTLTHSHTKKHFSWLSLSNRILLPTLAHPWSCNKGAWACSSWATSPHHITFSTTLLVLQTLISNSRSFESLLKTYFSYSMSFFWKDRNIILLKILKNYVQYNFINNYLQKVIVMFMFAWCNCLKNLSLLPNYRRWFIKISSLNNSIQFYILIFLFLIALWLSIAAIIHILV